MRAEAKESCKGLKRRGDIFGCGADGGDFIPTDGVRPSKAVVTVLDGWRRRGGKRKGGSWMMRSDSCHKLDGAFLEQKTAVPATTLQATNRYSLIIFSSARFSLVRSENSPSVCFESLHAETLRIVCWRNFRGDGRGHQAI